MILRNEIITSRNNPVVKWASSLADKKGRGETKCFLAEGVKLTEEALAAALPVTHIFVQADKIDEVLEKYEKYLSGENYRNTEIIGVSASVLDKISTEKSPQGIISVIKYLDFFRNMDIIYKEEFFLSCDERAIALCSLRDPGNLGSVIRSAVAFGVEHIVISDDCADVYNPKVVRSAMGSLFKLKITIVKDFTSFISAAKESGRRVFAAELRENAKALSDVGLLRSDVVVIGNEGHGIPEELSNKCTASVYIPISERTESLNASVAAAVFMWEQSKA